MEERYHDQALPAEEPLVFALMTGRTIPKLAYSLLPNSAKTYLTEKTLEHGLPFFKLLNNAKKYGNIGTKYYKEHIHPYVEHNNTFGNDYYFPNGAAGKPDYKYMKQYPTLRKNVRESQEFIYLDNNKPRTDANGFDNVKVNYKGNNYSYQFKNSAYDNRKEFHNIKPYELVEEELKKKIPKTLYDALMNK